MNEVVGTLWTVAGFLGAACVVGLLVIVLIGIVRGIVKSFKKRDRHDG